MRNRSEERMVVGSPFNQGEDEEIARKILVPSSWGDPPFSAISTVVKEYDSDTEVFTDVTSDKITGSANSTGSEILTPVISGLEAGKVYIVETKFTAANGAKFEFWFELRGEE